MVAQVKSTWSGIDVREFAPYKEQRQIALINRVWSDRALKTEVMPRMTRLFERWLYPKPKTIHS